MSPFVFFKHCFFFGGVFATRFAGGFGARDYRQTAAGSNAGGFGGRGGRNQGGHGGARGFGGGEIILLIYYVLLIFQLRMSHF